MTPTEKEFFSKAQAAPSPRFNPGNILLILILCVLVVISWQIYSSHQAAEQEKTAKAEADRQAFIERMEKDVRERTALFDQQQSLQHEDVSSLSPPATPAISATPVQPPQPPDHTTIQEVPPVTDSADSVQPRTYSGDPQTHVGPRGGVYHYSDTGKKVYSSKKK